MSHWSNKVYTTYKQMCKDIKKDPVDKEDFVTLVEKQRRILTYMTKLGRPFPWVVTTIDNKFSIYAAVQNATVVVNILTQEEIKAFGIESAGGKKRASI